MFATTHLTSEGRQRRTRPAHVATLMTMVGLLLAMAAGPATAQGRGLTAETLQQAGWTCLDQEGHLPTPCLPDAEAVFAGEAATSIVLTFGPDGRDFWGTELLLHHDLYNGQPCPQDQVAGGDGGYVDLLPLNGIPYFVCHHFDSPVT